MCEYSSIHFFQGYGHDWIGEKYSKKPLTCNCIPHSCSLPQFIQAVTQAAYSEDFNEVSHSLGCTIREVSAIRTKSSSGQNMVLVDTPGFDDPEHSDLEIRRI